MITRHTVTDSTTLNIQVRTCTHTAGIKIVYLSKIINISHMQNACGNNTVSGSMVSA